MEKYVIKIIFKHSSAYLMDEKGNICYSDESAMRFTDIDYADQFGLNQILIHYPNNTYCIEPVKS